MRPKSATVRSTTARSGGGVADVEHLDRNVSGYFSVRSATESRSADRTDDTITAVEQLFGEVTAEAAADSGDEPGALRHRHRPFGSGATSLTARSPLSVRG